MTDLDERSDKSPSSNKPATRGERKRPFVDTW